MARAPKPIEGGQPTWVSQSARSRETGATGKDRTRDRAAVSRSPCTVSRIYSVLFIYGRNISEFLLSGNRPSAAAVSVEVRERALLAYASDRSDRAWEDRCCPGPVAVCPLLRGCGCADAPVLPRQNLTTQTAKVARERVKAAGLDVLVIELLAGSDDNDEDLRPDQPAIIVATQDLFFSRALNRGYARRPPRWPVDFALYNQDCLIVLDEIQLMDDALATSTQLAAFRERFGVFGDAPCIWMSATVNPDWLRTVDFRIEPRVIRLGDDDRAHELVNQRIQAENRLSPAPEECRTPPGCAAFVLKRHRPGTRSLIIANTVPRARQIFAAVRKEFAGAVLLHSRFRPGDRRRAANALEEVPAEGQIVVTTQVLEAGVDITSRLLVTDLAPWGSLVQRFGRVNRYGDDVDAEIWWVDEPSSSKAKDPAAPYSASLKLA